MSPQRSNRSNLVEGTLRLLERVPADRVTARAIARESGANIASITYHFGSKDELVSEAAILGLDRWLEEIDGRLASLTPGDRFAQAIRAIEATRESHLGLVRNYIAALALAQHDARVRETLAAGFARSRPRVAAVLGLGDDAAGADAGGLVLALFHGLLIQVLLDESLAIEGERMARAQARLRRVLPERG